MTEDEAKKKWCCGPKIVGDSIFANRWDAKGNKEPLPVGANGFCIASKCMAWRVRPEHHEQAGDGYCGLAGKP